MNPATYPIQYVVRTHSAKAIESWTGKDETWTFEGWTHPHANGLFSHYGFALADLMGQRDEYLDWHRENLKTRTSGSKENK